MRCSLDLRRRVVAFVQRGGSKAEAARRFQVGEASVYRWLKPDGLTDKHTPRKPHKLDWEALRQHVAEFPDWTQKNALNILASRAIVSGTLCAA
jgi:transposase